METLNRVNNNSYKVNPLKLSYLQLLDPLITSSTDTCDSYFFEVNIRSEVRRLARCDFFGTLNLGVFFFCEDRLSGALDSSSAGLSEESLMYMYRNQCLSDECFLLL